MKVIHVDDSEIFRESFKKLLFEITDIKIFATANGVEEGINLIVKEKPDLAILDFQMKDGTAIDLLKGIYKLGLKHVVVLSNYSDDLYKEAAFKQGATQYFDKNNDMFELIDFLKKNVVIA